MNRRLFQRIVDYVARAWTILLGYGFGPFSLPHFKRYGFSSAQHDVRADLVTLLRWAYLFIVGSGRWSLDRLLDRAATSDPRPPQQ